MKACGVDLQPPRLPTRITRACGARDTISGLARSSSNTISAAANALAALIVSRSRSPGPALSKVTLPVVIVMSFGGLIALDYACEAQQPPRCLKDRRPE